MHMKKVHLFLSALALSLIPGGSDLSAQDYQWREDKPMTTITPGVEVVLRNGYGSGDFLQNSNVSSDGNNNDAVYVFEAGAPLDDNTPTYYLKQVSTGQYITMGGTISAGGANVNSLTYTSDQGSAFCFTAKPAVYYASSEEADASGDYSNATILELPEGGYPFIITGIEYFEDETLHWLCSDGGSNAIFHGFINTNVWYIYETEKASGYQWLRNTISSLFPAGVTEDNWPVGDDPGHISDDVFQSLVDAYSEANQMTSSTPAEECNAMVERLKQVYEEAKAAMKPVVAGYYYMTNHRDATMGVHAGTNANGVEGVRWTSGYDFPETPDIDDAAYIWQLEEADGGFTIKNFSNGRYVADRNDISVMLEFTDEPVVHTIVPQTANNKGARFNIQAADHPNINTWNADPNGNIVYWAGNNGQADGNCFTLYSIDPAALEGMTETVQQNNRNTQLTKLVKNAKASLKNARGYATEAEKNSDYTVPGLADAAEFLSTNAQEPTEGAMANIVDADLSTYFHSIWSAGWAKGHDESEGNAPHYLQVTLPQPVSGVALKMTKRWKNANQADNAPTVVEIQASTDGGTSFATVPGYEEAEINYQYPATVGEETRQNVTGILYVEDLPEGTNALRMVVLHTVSDGANKTSGAVFFSLSEFRVYEAAYDPELSILEKVPAEIREALNNAIAKAEAELAEEKATDATIAELSEAYDAFLENLPDPQRAKDALDAARSLLETAVEGEGLGYFTAGSKATFEAAINAQAGLIKEAMTLDEVESVTAAIDAATEEFLNALITPEVNTFYVIRSATSSTGTNYMLYAPSNSDVQNPVRAGGYDSETQTSTVNPSQNLNYLWYVESKDGRNITLRNAGTGLYMGHQDGLSKPVYFTTEPTQLPIQYARTEGCFNIIVGTDASGANMYCNLQGGTGPNMVGWTSANGNDNSALKFEATSFDFYGMNEHAIDGNDAQIMCLPYSIYGYNDNAAFYDIAGSSTDGTKLYLQPTTDEILEPGRPFVYIPNEGVELDGSDYFYVVETGEDGTTIPQLTLTGLSHNGLQGTITGDTIANGLGVVSNGKLYVTTGNYRNAVGANSGWITPDYPKNFEPEEDLPYFEINGEINAIDNVTVVKNERVDVYTATGVAVRKGVLRSNATDGLPKGVYIVGGQKVLKK